ncbi:MAG: hypothetical protein ABIS50_14085 [Luteolibacter sp.]|uniref:hypothetical protein n=1 Tax=Luteolibacter sp. TaxID=1962973 RepID=UPI0032643CCF
MTRIAPRTTFLLATAIGSFLATAADERVWIFTGLPGDEEHHADFEKTLGSLKTGFTQRLGVSPENIAVYYGPKSAGYAGEATRENILAAVKEIAAMTKQSPSIAHWIIFMGHANGIRGGAQVNLPGADLNSMDLAVALAECNEAAPLTFIFTHTASAPFLRPLAAPGRVIITATAPGGMENETEFPASLAESINDRKSDANKDGKLDANEIFLATRERVLKRYQAENLIVRESALLDGDGDGRGTQRPAEIDASSAAKHFFTLTTEGKDLE